MHDVYDTNRLTVGALLFQLETLLEGIDTEYSFSTRLESVENLIALARQVIAEGVEITTKEIESAKAEVYERGFESGQKRVAEVRKQAYKDGRDEAWATIQSCMDQFIRDTNL